MGEGGTGVGDGCGTVGVADGGVVGAGVLVWEAVGGAVVAVAVGGAPVPVAVGVGGRGVAVRVAVGCCGVGDGPNVAVGDGPTVGRRVAVGVLDAGGVTDAVGVVDGVKVAVGVIVGVGVSVADAVGVGVRVATTGPSSNEPMSHVAVPSPSPSTGRCPPRWSVEGQPVLFPVSTAGLELSRACVLVLPPLSARGSSLGSMGAPEVPTRSSWSIEKPLHPEPSPTRLLPSELN